MQIKCTMSLQHIQITNGTAYICLVSQVKQTQEMMAKNWRQSMLFGRNVIKCSVDPGSIFCGFSLLLLTSMASPSLSLTLHIPLPWPSLFQFHHLCYTIFCFLFPFPFIFLHCLLENPYGIYSLKYLLKTFLLLEVFDTLFHVPLPTATKRKYV